MDQGARQGSVDSARWIRKRKPDTTHTTNFKKPATQHVYLGTNSSRACYLSYSTCAYSYIIWGWTLLSPLMLQMRCGLRTRTVTSAGPRLTGSSPNTTRLSPETLVRSFEISCNISIQHHTLFSNFFRPPHRITLFSPVMPRSPTLIIALPILPLSGLYRLQDAPSFFSTCFCVAPAQSRTWITTFGHFKG